MFAEARLNDGTRALIWDLRPGDREAVREGFEQLSEETRFHRFLAAVPHLTDTMLDHLVDEVDGVDHVAIALVVLDADGTGVPAGVARMIRYSEQRDAADVAVTVIDQFQRRGVATALLGELMRRRPVGIRRLVTTVTADNAASLAMLRRLGPTVAEPAGPNRLDVVVELPSDGGPGGEPGAGSQVEARAAAEDEIL
ncbi:GNAT family N-acetyltransferase [Nocardioides sp.]|uniref:GNAT family N-acetyltransferase n=1 Tax=Nocardioides sp. TaxID=35761 RepID=UPI00261A9240|nr:GNAT family N-acetyltransferase [Nocardioides sp.]MDI6908325.1 GNAT family N-acetyltransferase [Nocardioides sp.]